MLSLRGNLRMGYYQCIGNPITMCLLINETIIMISS